MSDYPVMAVGEGHMQPVPRRIRAVAAGRVVLDTTRALYVWERPYYPQYYVPIADVDRGLLVEQDQLPETRRGKARRVGLRVGGVSRPAAGYVYPDADTDDAIEGLSGMVRFDWDAMDAWYEEDERVFVHPRNPYVRVDALRSTRHVRIELDGTVLGESSSPVMLFETGLPTRYYLNRSEVEFGHLRASDTVTACPYKGRTTGYWSAHTGDDIHPDVAWCYDFPTREALPIAGMIAFYNEKVDVYLDGTLLERPVTHFS